MGQEQTDNFAVLLFVKVKPRKVILRGRFYNDKELIDIAEILVDTKAVRPYTVEARGVRQKTYMTFEQALQAAGKVISGMFISEMEVPDAIKGGIYQDSEPANPHRGGRSTTIKGIF